MKLLRAEENALKYKEKHKLIGLHAPRWVHSYLTLYAASRKMSKNDLLKYIFNEWLQKEREENPEEILLMKLIEHVIKAYAYHKKKYNMTKEEFVERAQKELKRKGLLEGYINVVLSKIV